MYHQGEVYGHITLYINDGKQGYVFGVKQELMNLDYLHLRIFTSDFGLGHIWSSGLAARTYSNIALVLS